VVYLIPIRLGAKATPGTFYGRLEVLHGAYCTIIAYSPTYSCTLKAVFGLCGRVSTGGGVNANVDLFRYLFTEAPEDLTASACQARMESVDD
jgi:hypothetical protein